MPATEPTILLHVPEKTPQPPQNALPPLPPPRLSSAPRNHKNSKTRKRLSNKRKRELLLDVEKLDLKKDISQRHKWLEEHNISWENVRKWDKNSEEIMNSTGTASKKQKTCSSHRKSHAAGHFPVQQKKLYSKYRVRRAKGLRVSGMWLQAKMKTLVQADKPKNFEKFKASDNWKQKFVKRHGISNQQKTNNKSKSIEERLPKVKRFHQWAVYRMALEDP